MYQPKTKAIHTPHLTCLHTHSNITNRDPILPTPSLCSPEVALILTIPIRIRLAQCAHPFSTSTGTISSRRPKSDLRTRHLRTSTIILCIENEILNKPKIRAFNPTRLYRERIFPDMRRIPQHCIDQGPRPGASPGRVLDH